MRLLITRPAVDAAATAAALRARGHDPIIAPLLTIETLSSVAIAAGPWSAILVTSANAAHAIAVHPRHDDLRRVPVFAVGAHSAQAMRDAGFAEVTSADGDVGALAKLAAGRTEPGALLLYLAGAARSGDLAGALRKFDRAVHTVVVYRAAAAETFPPEAATALAAGIDGVFHYSRRSVEAYINAARQADLVKAGLADPVHFCLSAEIAAPLSAAGAMTIRIAETPEETALLALCA